MLKKRIIPCLDVKDGRVVKGVQFRDHQVMGDILDYAALYRDQGADELVFYDITASVDARSVSLDWIEAVARVIDIPFAVAGGIRSIEHAAACLERGADKISINTPALLRPDLINELVAVFGSQCIVVGIDSFQDDAGGYRVKQFTGAPDATEDSGRETLDWVREVQARGAGEIVLNCMNLDGARTGYDIDQLSAVRAVCSIPLIASGGAGGMAHFRDVFAMAHVDGALAASVFHKGMMTVGDLKKWLDENGVEVRL